MSNLSNLYISQSFFGVVNLENSLQPLTSASGDTQLQDGVGSNLGVIINSGSNTITLDRNVNVSDNLIVSGNAEFKGNVDVSGSWIHTGSIDVLGDVTIEGNVSANVATFDTVNTRVLHVTEESASVIFSSGSNILGDELSDTQILSGSVYIPNVEYLNGNPVDTDTRINNLNTHSASVEQSIESLNAYTSSADVKFTTIGNVTSSLNAFTSSQQNINTGYNAFTASVTQSITDVSASFEAGQLVQDQSLINVSASFEVGQLVQDQRLDSLEIYTGSVNLNYIERSEYNVYTASIEVEQLAQDSRLNQLSVETGSYVRTDTNNTFSGSINAEVIPLTIVSTTASMDCSQGNFFSITLNDGTNRLQPSNLQSGQTISLKVVQPAAGYGQLTSSNDVKFPQNFNYVPTVGVNSIDVITFVSFDTNSILAVSSNNLT